MSAKPAFGRDELVSRIVRYLCSDKPDSFGDDRQAWLLGALGIIAVEQKWYYLMQLCVPSLFDGLSDEIPGIDDDEVLQHLIFGHRINDALCLKEQGREALAARLGGSGLKLPARRFNLPGTDRWETPDSVLAMIEDIGRSALRLPKFVRTAWVTQVLRSRCAKLNGQMAQAAEFNMTRHMMATGIQWKRIARESQDEALHIRIHYSSGILSVAVQSKGLAKSKRTILPLAIAPFLTDAERPHIDRHFALRFISMRVFETLSLLQHPVEPERLDAYLHFFYLLLLHDIMVDTDVVTRLAELGEYPTVVVTCHGALAQLPFAALHDGERYLAERFNIVQAAPLFPEGDFQEGDLDVEAVWGGEPLSSREVRVVAGGDELPQIEHEIADLRALSAETALPLEIWSDESGDDWSADTLRWLFGTKGVALLSAHMEASPENAEDAVVVSPGGTRIRIGDALSSGSEAGLVLLSACRSASFTDWFGPGENSVTSLCRRAGAKSTVSTLWPTRDYPARLYSVEMIAGLGRGLSRAAAHGAALRHVMAASANVGQMHFGERLARQPRARTADIPINETTLKHPHFWAAFMLTGSWR